MRRLEEITVLEASGKNRWPDHRQANAAHVVALSFVASSTRIPISLDNCNAFYRFLEMK